LPPARQADTSAEPPDPHPSAPTGRPTRQPEPSTTTQPEPLGRTRSLTEPPTPQTVHARRACPQPEPHARFGRYASELAPLPLARAKAGSQLALCIGTLVALSSIGSVDVGEWAGSVTPDELTILFAVALWNGLIPSAFTTWAQTYGQAAVPPSAANVLYSFRAPLFAPLRPSAPFCAPLRPSAPFCALRRPSRPSAPCSPTASITPPLPPPCFTRVRARRSLGHKLRACARARAAEPVWNAALASLVLGEQLSSFEIAGGACIVLGAVLAADATGTEGEQGEA
jgi:hypothetical protein